VSPRRARVLLHRRQRLGRDGAHPQWAGAGAGLRRAPVPCPQDHRQRPVRHRSLPGLRVRGAFRRLGVHGRQPGQPQPAGDQDRHRDGTPRGLADGGQRARPAARGWRPAPGLRARADFRPRRVPGRCGSRLHETRPLPGGGFRGRAPGRREAPGREQGNRLARERATLGVGSPGRPPGRRDPGPAGFEPARARRHLRLSAAFVRRIRLAGRRARGARGRSRRRAHGHGRWTRPRLVDHRAGGGRGVQLADRRDCPQKRRPADAYPRRGIPPRRQRHRPCIPRLRRPLGGRDATRDAPLGLPSRRL